MTAADRLSITFAALADPTRRAILTRLASGEATVSELAAPFEISQPAISRHLRVLEGAGLITRGRDAQRRPARIAGAPLRVAADWMEQYRQHWDTRLDRLSYYLQQSQAKPRASSQPRTRERHARKRTHDR